MYLLLVFINKTQLSDLAQAWGTEQTLCERTGTGPAGGMNAHQSRVIRGVREGHTWYLLRSEWQFLPTNSFSAAFPCHQNISLFLMSWPWEGQEPSPRLHSSGPPGSHIRHPPSLFAASAAWLEVFFVSGFFCVIYLFYNREKNQLLNN